MKSLGLSVGILIAFVGLVGVIAPERLVTWSQPAVTPVGLYVVAAVRLGFGLALVMVAPASRAPIALRIFGVVAIVAGLTTPLVGVERARAVLDWWSVQGHTFIRLTAMVAVAAGGFIVCISSSAGRAQPDRNDQRRHSGRKRSARERHRCPHTIESCINNVLSAV